MITSSNSCKIQESFKQQAKGFETKAMSFTKKEYLEYIVSCIRPKETDTVLEVASGTCACGRSLAPFVQNVTCLDMTPAMLYVGKSEAEKQSLRNMTFVLGDAEVLPFLDNSFDIVISRLAFHHFINPHRCFAEMTRVLSHDGILVLIDMEAAEDALRAIEDEIETMRDLSHVRNLSKSEFYKLFRDNNLTVCTSDYTEIPVSLSAWLALTDTSDCAASNITKRLENEINGGEKTGFNPYRTNGDIYFKQRWIMIIGKKEK